MQETTAKMLRKARDFLGRDFSTKERRQLVAEVRVHGGLATVGWKPYGGRLKVLLTYADGEGRVLSPKPTGGAVYRDGKPIDPTVKPATPLPVLRGRRPRRVCRRDGTGVRIRRHRALRRRMGAD